MSRADPDRLRAGAAKAAITPPLEVGLLMSAVDGLWEPFAEVRRDLFARALVVDHAEDPIAIVSLDLLGLCGRAVGNWGAFLERIAESAGGKVRAANIVLACTHTHTAPESLALTDLHETQPFRVWIDRLAQRIGGTIADAARNLVPCRMSAGSGFAEGHGIHRRIKTTEGVKLSNAPPPPETILSTDGPVDNSVFAAAFRSDGGPTIATLVGATCHPVHEMCMRHVSGDFPGELSGLLEERTGGAALYFNGASGNINPPIVSGGPDDSRRHGRQLADVVCNALRETEAAGTGRCALVGRMIELPARNQGDSPLPADLAAVRIADMALVFLPGELFVETGLAIKEASPFGSTAIIGCAGDWIGYIPPAAAFDEGGYELGPGPWARAGRGAEEILRREAIDLIGELWNER